MYGPRNSKNLVFFLFLSHFISFASNWSRFDEHDINNYTVQWSFFHVVCDLIISVKCRGYYSFSYDLCTVHHRVMLGDARGKMEVFYMKNSAIDRFFVTKIARNLLSKPVSAETLICSINNNYWPILLLLSLSVLLYTSFDLSSLLIINSPHTHTHMVYCLALAGTWFTTG